MLNRIDAHTQGYIQGFNKEAEENPYDVKEQPEMFYAYSRGYEEGLNDT